MSEIMGKIFQELNELEAAAGKLRAAADGAKNQTDLEVAILGRQLADQREKNARAAGFIDEALEKLKPLTLTTSH